MTKWSYVALRKKMSYFRVSPTRCDLQGSNVLNKNEHYHQQPPNYIGFFAAKKRFEINLNSSLSFGQAALSFCFPRDISRLP